jgi:D-alanyl-lipoteichoic acid acyltransferase DltB (MBOAT superfamily)
MLFNSIEFAFFFPIVTVLFFLTPHKLRWLLLLSASCVFYMYFKPEYILILAFIIVIDYLVAIQIEQQQTNKRKKLWLIFSLLANFGVLFFFKYFNFAAANFNYALNLFHSTGKIAYLNLILPIGLSFHTLQAMSYTIEVSKGKFKAERHFGIYALYVMFYPQLVAGPIERPQNLIPQFHQKKYFSYENARKGTLLIAWGLIKKMVIADRLGAFVHQVHLMPDGYYTGIPLIIAFFACPIQVYCDFSGYSDIATGCAKFMGYDLMVNFKTPFQQPNVNKYWSAWHISLTTWFRDYVYMPVRKHYLPNTGMWLSILIVLVLSGIWHGASWNFVFWGVSNAILVIAYNFLKRNKLFLSLTSRISDFWANKLMILSLTTTTIFFRCSSVPKAFHMLRDMFKNIFLQISLIIKNPHGERLQYLYVKQSLFELLVAIGLVAGLMFIESKFVNNNIDSWLLSKNKKFRWFFYYTMLAIFLLLGKFDKSEFIYFQF